MADTRLSNHLVQVNCPMSLTVYIILLLSGKNFYCNKKLGLIPFAGVNPICLDCVRPNQKTKLWAKVVISSDSRYTDS